MPQSLEALRLELELGLGPHMTAPAIFFTPVAPKHSVSSPAMIYAALSLARYRSRLRFLLP